MLPASSDCSWRMGSIPVRCVWFLLGIVLCSFLASQCEAVSAFPPEVKTYTEKEAKKFLKNLNKEWARKTSAYFVARWEYESNMTPLNLANKQKVALDVAKFQKQQRKEAVKYPRDKIQDKDMKRQLAMYSKLGTPGLTDDKYVKFQNVLAHFTLSPRCNKIPCLHEEGLSAEAELKQRMDCWLQRRYGQNATDLFSDLVSLLQEAAVMDNYTDYSQYMLRNYEQEDLVQRMNDLVDKVQPLYKEMHAYCRNKLRQRYGGDAVPNGGLIPDHLADSSICYTDPILSKPLDFPGALRAKDFTVRKLFGLPDEFYRSLNMSLPEQMWKESFLEVVPNRTMSCKPIAQDVLFRIRSCSKVNEESLFGAARIVTEIMSLWIMETTDQPSIYRHTGNDAFVEGVGGAVALSLVSPNFLRYQGLLAGDDSVEMDVNLLYMIARNTLIPAMRAYSTDVWRVETLSKKFPSQRYNCEWWRNRQQLEGVSYPVNRSDRDFDPASNPLVLRDPLSTPFKTTFGMVLAFQLHRSLCLAAGLYDAEDPGRLPLHRCNLLGQPTVSELFKKMLQTGGSKPWHDVLEQAIGQRELDPSAMEVYFQPLRKYLGDWNTRTGEVIGWNTSDSGCGGPRSELKEKDPAGAAAGYYSCPDGEGPEPPKPAPTIAPPSTTEPPTTMASPSSTLAQSSATPSSDAPSDASSAAPAVQDSSTVPPTAG